MKVRGDAANSEAAVAEVLNLRDAEAAVRRMQKVQMLAKVTGEKGLTGQVQEAHDKAVEVCKRLQQVELDDMKNRVDEVIAVQGQLNDKSQELAKIALVLRQTHTRSEPSTRAMGAARQEVETATHKRCSSSGYVEDFLEFYCRDCGLDTCP